LVAVITVATWPPGWSLLLLVPLAVSATHQIAELAVRAVVESARARIRHQRETLVTSILSAPLAEWLARWPATGGSSIEKLQDVLQRVPETIRDLEQRVAEKVRTWATA
jgi:predicted secreted protein